MASSLKRVTSTATAKPFTDLAISFPLQELIFHSLRRSPTAYIMQNRHAVWMNWSWVVKGDLFLGPLPHSLQKGKALQWIKWGTAEMARMVFSQSQHFIMLYCEKWT